MDAVTIVLAVGAVAGLHMAWFIGVRDGANVLGISVGSGALSLRQGLVVAVGFELLGALRAGGAVNETVAVRLAPLVEAGEPPVVLAAAAVAALVAALVSLHTFAAIDWPVSSTHAVVGAVVGVGLWVGGAAGVEWGVVASVLGGWLVAPVLALLAGYAVFVGLSLRVLRAPGAARRLLWFGPLLTWAVLGALTWTALEGGARTTPLVGSTATGAAAVAVGALGALGIGLLIRRSVEGDGGDTERAEAAFAWLQWPTASFLAFAHGSNDAANAVGPMSAIFGLVRGHGGFDAHGPFVVPTNLLLIAGFGIALGLSTFGLRSLESLGRELRELTPSRGFAAELAAAFVLAGASALGLSVSATSTLLGAVVGVGLGRGLGALDLRVVRRMAAGWGIAIPLTAALAAGLAALTGAWLR